MGTPNETSTYIRLGMDPGTWAPPDAPVYSPAFDTTPAELITSWILDDTVLSWQDVGLGALTLEP